MNIKHRNQGTILIAAAVLIGVVAVAVMWFLGQDDVMDDTSWVITDTTAPVIDGDDVIEIYKNDVPDVKSHYKITDDSEKEVEVKVEGECDTTIIGSCAFTIIAKDKAGNEAKRDIVVNVVVDPEIANLGLNEYYVKVNRSQNVVMVYALDRDGEYTKLAKTYVASTGAPESQTPLGTFKVSDRFEALYLVGNVWGHYAVRIDGPIFFHSVPYFTKGEPHWDNLEYLEYNKLGEGASAGCVRLAVRDAKWVFENIPAGTMVEIFDADELPEGVVKPVPIRIDTESENRGWDPTDPDEENPWNAKTAVMVEG
ncbi:L,D-transpeptidase [Candidatus Saccharibacteria bacterium]|nr:L,D-transpeptidase [Candidatus Saccharibacteria bacterium]